MRASLLLLLALAVAAAPAAPATLGAQQPAGASATGTLVVTVADDSTGHPVARATVRVRDAAAARRTGADGVARLAAVLAGTRVIEVSVPGYAPQSLQVEVAAGAAQEVPIYLLPQLQQVRLAGVTATATSRVGQLTRNGFYDRQAIERGSFLDAGRIATRRARRLADILATLRGFSLIPQKFQGRPPSERAPGEEARGQPAELLVTTRTQGPGGGACVPGFVVNGTPVSAEFILDMDPGEVEAVEAYPTPSTVPAQFGGSNARCGLVMVWTRSTAG